MKIILTAVLFLTGAAAYAQSLGDLAREEQKRREGISGEKVITLKSAPIEEPIEEPEKEKKVSAKADAKEPQHDDGEDSGEDSENSEEAKPDEMKDLYGKTESHWRNAISEAQNNIKQLEDEAKELTSRRNALQRRHDGANGSRRAPIKDEIDRTRQAQETNKKNLEEAREKLQSLRNDARSSGALPGWIE